MLFILLGSHFPDLLHVGNMAFIPTGDTEKLLIIIISYYWFVSWRNWENVSKVDAIKKKQGPFSFREKRGIKEIGFFGFGDRPFHKLNKMFSLLLNAYKIYIPVQKQLSCTRLRMQ